MAQETTRRRRSNNHNDGKEAQHGATQDSQRRLPLRLVQEHPAPSAFFAFGLGVGIGLSVAALFADSLLGSRKEELSSAEKFGKQFLHALSSIVPDRIRNATHC